MFLWIFSFRCSSSEKKDRMLCHFQMELTQSTFKIKPSPVFKQMWGNNYQKSISGKTTGLFDYFIIPCIIQQWVLHACGQTGHFDDIILLWYGRTCMSVYLSLFTYRHWNSGSFLSFAFRDHCHFFCYSYMLTLKSHYVIDVEKVQYFFMIDILLCSIDMDPFPVHCNTCCRQSKMTWVQCSN